jgi:hypothetical protein
MDWTTNPFVALYFASEHERAVEGDGAVWWFRRRDRRDDVDVFSDKNKEPAEIPGIRVIYPFYPTPRMTAQSALFTIHAHPWVDLRVLSAGTYSTDDCDIVEGHRWIVPKDRKAQVLAELNRFGIHSRTLFPELDGLAKGLIQEEVFRGPEQYRSAP